MYSLDKIDTIANNLDDFEKFCAITVALKISDDSCKMDEYEKSVFMALYNAISDKSSTFFDEAVFELISTALNNPTAKIYSDIKTLREEAMETITRPKMKAFKAGVRAKLI